MTVRLRKFNTAVLEQKILPFGEGKQSAWPPMAVSAQKNPGGCPDPLRQREPTPFRFQPRAMEAPYLRAPSSSPHKVIRLCGDPIKRNRR